MSGGPADASIAGDGFRWYSWTDSETKVETRVLSVTSIRKLCGESYQLVAWQIANVVNAATGMTKRVVIGPRGGRSEKYVRDGEGRIFEGLLKAADTQKGLEAAREWLMKTAEAPRDTAAIRGTLVHESIELNIRPDRIDEVYMEAAVGRLSQRDRDKAAKHGGMVTDDDVAFVRQGNAQFWDLREKVPFVILAKEPQVWNLEAGYAGSSDVLMWFLGDWDSAGAFQPLPDTGPETVKWWQKQADRGNVTQADIARVGGHVTLGDWKTSKGVYTDQVIQVHAYLAAEFVGSNGLRDERLTDILAATSKAAIVHIRPEGWTIHFVQFETDVLRAFLGSVALARFLASHKQPFGLFTHDVKGAAVIEGPIAEDAA